MNDRRTALVGLAALGALVGHGIAYALPHGPTDAVGLHGYLHLAGPLVAVAGIASMIWVAAQAARRRLRIPLHTLVAIQVLLFLTQEVGERLVAGGAAAGVLASPGLWLAIAVQVAVALAVGLVVGLLAGVVWAWPAQPVVHAVTLIRRQIRPGTYSVHHPLLVSPRPVRGPPGGQAAA